MNNKVLSKNISEVFAGMGDKFGLLAVLFILCAALTMINESFMSRNNIINILLSASTNGVVASGVSFVILIGGLDLSVGSVVALSGAFVATLLNSGIPVFYAISLTLAFGLLLGIINAFFINELKVNPLITTLGTMMVYRGAAFIVSGGSAVYIRNEGFYTLGTGSFLGLPIPVVVLLLVFLVFYFILSQTIFGRNLYIIGGNSEAARLCGINTRLYTYIIYALCAAMATLSGIVLAARMTSGQPTAADGLELDAVTAVVLGGATLTGGVGTMFGTIVGILILTVFRNGLLIMNVDAFYQYIASGMLLLLAVTFDQLRNR